MVLSATTRFVNDRQQRTNLFARTQHKLPRPSNRQPPGRKVISSMWDLPLMLDPPMLPIKTNHIINLEVVMGMMVESVDMNLEKVPGLWT
ncbi:hypothetical protein SBOR_6920 [Sclerotinia borealis F-4128]|uniref:Uncharacterized protein n=1 Tax=Sclerotinia borealis (strain F-4128) TaxID=1432307 RepID=W9CA80_SCLBF|nr:hypothetical protein SBOR_6920 [Sclerotinia borealis F-4128]